MLARRAAPLLLALALAGCKGKPKPGEAVTCDRMATHVTTLAKADMVASSVTGDERRYAETELTPLHDVVQAVCTDRQWPAEIRGCVAAASAGAGVAACVAGLPAVARTPIAR